MIEQFSRPSTIEEAVEHRTRTAESGYYAGGTWINHARTECTITHALSLECLGLDQITGSAKQLSIGAMVTFQQLVDSKDVPASIQAAARGIYSRNVRNMATVGGALASKWAPSSLYPVLAALEARIRVADGTSYSVSEYLTSGTPQQLITAVEVAEPQQDVRLFYEARSRGSRHLYTGAARDERLAVYLSFPGVPLTELSLEKTLVDSAARMTYDALVDQLLPLCSAAVPKKDDLHGSREYLSYSVAARVAMLLQPSQGGDK
ncbi:MAG: FAD binding domain-containing protein [Spirochaetota bacterium]